MIGEFTIILKWVFFVAVCLFLIGMVISWYSKIVIGNWFREKMMSDLFIKKTREEENGKRKSG